MNPGIYFDTLDGIVRQKELAVISQNLSNLSTPGYKRERIAFQKYFFSVIENRKTDFSKGDLRHTGNTFDLAISGKENVFFVVRSADGKELYTRRGDFCIGNDKKLMTVNGFFVQGRSGDITVNGRRIEINKEGEVIVDGKVVDKLRLVSVPTETLVRYGRTMFYAKNTQNIKPAKDYEILQGYLETSNVKPVEEMIRIVDCLRNYEICQKSIQSHDEITSRLINDVGIVRA